MSSAAPKSWGVEELLKLLHEFPLLENFPPNLLTELAKSTEVLELPVNTQILQQGQMNEHLYFLVDGKVGIYVDGGRVSKMQRKGDLLGEMSVITSKPVGATILAETPVL